MMTGGGCDGCLPASAAWLERFHLKRRRHFLVERLPLRPEGARAYPNADRAAPKGFARRVGSRKSRISEILGVSLPPL